ncbi:MULTISPECIES: sigma-54 dependent transcriptional regulator [unclassified Thioalkalivibrio]|uniref:sigma-54 dependent transcriptional regulator n=1 Tax=unclassified Thioalkalivibrio TaxID=2621013 RepID=UPI000380AE2C|nr:MULTISPECIES: sigma-54 dependent transcriptional regulator [unclassified Thioalkalivibrio]
MNGSFLRSVDGGGFLPRGDADGSRYALQRACATSMVREVAWMDAGGCACDSLAGLSDAWKLTHVPRPAGSSGEVLDKIRVGLLDLGSPVPPWATELVHTHQHVKWIALVHPDLLLHDDVRELIRESCYDFHTLPLDQARLEITLGRACGMAALEARPVRPTRDAEPGDAIPIIGHSPAMQALARQIERVAGSEAPVLFQGESGTGKELAALAVHRHSRRANGPFVAVNCGALPAQLIQSELFGHEAGAFTGAGRRKIGQFELAHGGTLLLDEIGDLSLDLQVNLLRFLQEGTLVRLGGLQSIKVDVRVLAATHVALDKAVETGRFRQDLYYRLNVIQLDVPPLRERGTDLKELGRFYFDQFRRQNPRLRGFTQAAWQAMHAYSWPGNVRELVNRVRRAVTMAEGRLIRPEDLGLAAVPAQAEKPPTLAEARSNAERELLIKALGQCDNNVSRAARQLGVGRMTLYRLLAKHGLRSDAP